MEKRRQIFVVGIVAITLVAALSIIRQTAHIHLAEGRPQLDHLRSIDEPPLELIIASFSLPSVSSWEFREGLRRADQLRQQEITVARSTYRNSELPVPIAVRRSLIVLRENALAERHAARSEGAYTYCDFGSHLPLYRIRQIGPAALTHLKAVQDHSEFKAIRDHISQLITELSARENDGQLGFAAEAFGTPLSID